MSNTAAFKNFLSLQFTWFSLSLSFSFPLFFSSFKMWNTLVHGFWFRKACFFSSHFIRTEFHLFSICTGQHLEPQEIQLLCVWRLNEITFSCTSEEYQEHLSDQTGPFVLVQQVFLIKNVISLTNCFIAFAAGVIVFMVLYFCDSLREQKARRRGFLLYLPCICFDFPPLGWRAIYLPLYPLDLHSTWAARARLPAQTVGSTGSRTCLQWPRWGTLHAPAEPAELLPDRRFILACLGLFCLHRDGGWEQGKNKVRNVCLKLEYEGWLLNETNLFLL